MERYLSLLKDSGVDLAIKINTKTIQPAAWTVYRCRFGCDKYGKNH